METWKSIKKAEGFYEVSSIGRVKSLDNIVIRDDHGIKKPLPFKGRILSLWNTYHGYKMATICINKKRKSILVHRLVAEAFIPNPENKPQVNHIDGNRSNNRVDNLEWSTSSENQLHAINVLKSTKVGELHCCAKMKQEDVIKSIRLFQGGHTRAGIARIFKVSHSTIDRIVKRKSWKHLKLSENGI